MSVVRNLVCRRTRMSVVRGACFFCTTDILVRLPVTTETVCARRWINFVANPICPDRCMVSMRSHKRRSESSLRVNSRTRRTCRARIHGCSRNTAFTIRNSSGMALRAWSEFLCGAAIDRSRRARRVHELHTLGLARRRRHEFCQFKTGFPVVGFGTFGAASGSARPGHGTRRQRNRVG